MQILLLTMTGNDLSGTVPYMPSLVMLDMAVNRLTEPRFNAAPASLQLLFLGNNLLTGDMSQLSTSPAYMHLKLLDVSYNNLSGSLPQEMPPNLSILDLSNNAFAGTLPASWSQLKNIAELQLSNNSLMGTLPAAWSVWGNNTGNSLQMSITNTSIHGRIPKQWVEQFCLANVEYTEARVLFQPVDAVFFSGNAPWQLGPTIVLPARHASINVTLASKTYSFDYNNPDSVCGIPHTARNTALLWGIFALLMIAILMGICLWQRRKPNPGPQSGWFKHWKISTVLSHNTVHFGRRVANHMWFLVSDIGWTIYSLVTDAVTIHQVVASGQLGYAYLLLAILMLPFAFMFVLVVRISILRCQEQGGSSLLMRWVAAPLTGLLLAPLLFVGLELMLILHGFGVPLPVWWGSMGVDSGTYCRMQSVAEAFLNALPQSIVQTKLYFMGNDPNGVHVYIDTPLFLLSTVGSLLSVLKTLALIAIELHQYSCSLIGYGLALMKFDSFRCLPWTPVTP